MAVAEYIKASTGVKPESEQLTDNFFHRILVNFGEVSRPARGSDFLHASLPQQSAIGDAHEFEVNPEQHQTGRLGVPTANLA
jgi:hypothetical protein